MRHTTQLAKIGDGKRILEIMESSPAKGSIELLYTRRPDPFLSYKSESNDTQVFTVKDEDKIIATATEIVRDVYINSECKKLCYICGLKKDPNYPKRVNWGRLFIKNLMRDDIDCYFSSIISDNISAQKLFEKKRKHTLNHNFLQKYTTFMLTPHFSFKVSDKKYTFSRCKKCDEAELIEFLNNEGKKRDFFPVIKSFKEFANLDVTDFYTIKDKCKIVAAGALWNQSSYRQYIVKKYRGIMKLARLMNPILKVLGYIKLPKEDEALSFPMLSFLISKEDSEEYYKVFLNFIGKEIRKYYDMVVIGATECSAIYQILRKQKAISFDSKIYSIDFILGQKKSTVPDKDKIWLECGLL